MISIKIKDPLFTYHARLVNILDFNPNKNCSLRTIYRDKSRTSMSHAQSQVRFFYRNQKKS